MTIPLSLIAAALLVAAVVFGSVTNDSWKNVGKTWALLATGATVLGIILTL